MMLLTNTLDAAFGTLSRLLVIFNSARESLLILVANGNHPPQLITRSSGLVITSVHLATSEVLAETVCLNCT